MTSAKEHILTVLKAESTRVMAEKERLALAYQVLADQIQRGSILLVPKEDFDLFIANHGPFDHDLIKDEETCPKCRAMRRVLKGVAA